MRVNEIPIVFNCEQADLIGILHLPVPIDSGSIGVVIVVGGPQYRVGSHRQFVLLARYLAENGIPVMRFDVRGMGDSAGFSNGFEHITADIGTAIDVFLKHCPGLARVVLWGLCDAASASAFYAYQDSRVSGMVLLNPWVYTQQGAAKSYLKHYYLQRLTNPDLWRKVFSLRFDYLQSLRSLFDFACKALTGGKPVAQASAGAVDERLPLPERVRECLRRSSCNILIILSGRDLTADEFRDAVCQDLIWQELLAEPRITRRDLPEADHTFSTRAWRDQVAELTLDWLRKV